MHRVRSFLRFWLPALIWMAVIFSGSTNAGSTHHTSRIIGPILRWINPNVSDQTIENTQFVIRKIGHLTEYAILALLFWYALYKPRQQDVRPWSRRIAGKALMLAAIYSGSDEIHQAFVPTRQAQFSDVLIDLCGASLGILALWAFGRWRKVW